MSFQNWKVKTRKIGALREKERDDFFFLALQKKKELERERVMTLQAIERLKKKELYQVRNGWCMLIVTARNSVQR